MDENVIKHRNLLVVEAVRFIEEETRDAL
jgi:hypothetical protein